MKTNPDPNDKLLTNADGKVANQHSVLLLQDQGNRSTLYKMQVEATGVFTKPPVEASDTDAAKRLVYSLTGASMPDGPAQSTKSHVGFGILPIKADPTSAHFCCYLVNAGQLFPENVWTRGPWNVAPTAAPQDGLLAQLLSTPILLATEDGRVLQIDNSDDAIGLKAKSIDLKAQPELWRLLRNGCVVGEVQLTGSAKVQPLINLAAFVGKPPAQPAQKTLEGTLDFKWPKGSEIRIRIDPPSWTGRTAIAWAGTKVPLTKPQEEAAIAKVKDLATYWLTESLNPGKFTLKFLDSSEKDYDVLVNLDPLAAAQPDGVDPTGSDAPVRTPQSDLGTYCQRRPLGQPTSYCGHPEGLKGEDGQIITSYYDSRAFWHIVLHELGHIFGLAHLHQHPGRMVPIAAAPVDPALRQRIKAVLGLNVDDETLTTDLRATWPGDAQTYSDWPSLEGKAPGEFAAESVMIGPIRGVLEGDISGEPRLEYRIALGRKDIEWLQVMYP